MSNHLLFETEHFTASQADGYRIPGYVIVNAKSEVTELADFPPDVATELMQCLARAEALVKALIQPERIYLMKFGEMVPRVHFHIFPRTARIGDAYAAEVDDPKPYSGARLVDWIWQHHAALGFTDREIKHFVEGARVQSR
ncbi:MAG: diadenosine tetraphosphate (Ap4A) HIT family hydrolase [Planctomycetota bacterium]|jgi:diadenosine tetraphosphate (Ap4A) HIT family hydrolase